MKCWTGVRSIPHGVSTTKGLPGFDKELCVLEFHGILPDVEKILCVLYHEPGVEFISLLNSKESFAIWKTGPTYPVSSTSAFAIYQPAESDVQALASGDLCLYPRAIEDHTLRSSITKLSDVLSERPIYAGVNKQSMGSGSQG